MSTTAATTAQRDRANGKSQRTLPDRFDVLLAGDAEVVRAVRDHALEPGTT